MKNRVWTKVSTLVIAIGFFCVGAAAAADLSNSVIFPTGLTYDGTYLYLSSDSGFREIRRLDPATGAVIGSIPLGGTPRDLVFSGSGFLSSDMGSFVREVDATGVQAADFPLPFRGGAIAFDGTNIYAGDTDSSRVVVMDRAGTLLREFDSGLRPEGMVFDPGTGRLWVITLFDSRLFEISTNGVLLRACASPFTPGPFGLGGVTLVGPDHIYIAGAAGGDPFAGTAIHVLNRHTLRCQIFGGADEQPPVIAGLSVDQNEIWPPNHRMIDVHLTYVVSDDSGETPAVSVTVSNDETGDADWQLVDAKHVRLRATRFGSGDGRVYTITVTATDQAGNHSSESISVLVPRDQGH